MGPEFEYDFVDYDSINFGTQATASWKNTAIPIFFYFPKNLDICDSSNKTDKRYQGKAELHKTVPVLMYSETHVAPSTANAIALINFFQQ